MAAPLRLTDERMLPQDAGAAKRRAGAGSGAKCVGLGVGATLRGCPRLKPSLGRLGYQIQWFFAL